MTNFQQSYLIWFFPTIMWQKTGMIKNVVITTLASDIANCIYLFYKESYVYDFAYILILVGILVGYRLITCKALKKYLKNT